MDSAGNYAAAAWIFVVASLTSIFRLVSIANRKPAEPPWTPAGLEKELDRLESLAERLHKVGSWEELLAGR